MEQEEKAKANVENEETTKEETTNKETTAQTESDDTTETQATEATANDELNEIKGKLDALNDSHIRLMAEFDNYRKRTMREKAEWIKNANERIIVDILPIIDNFERALASMQTAEDVGAVRQGVELIYSQLMNMLKDKGVAPIETEGKPFDTEYHEAITTIPAPTPDMKDKIVDCTTRGYMLNDKVIRHSKVVVGA